MRPLIAYYGGKQRIVSKVLPYINQIPHTVYGEPFCGGATVLFALNPPIVGNRHDYREFINDLDGLLVNFYRVAKLRPDELHRLIDATLYSQDDYRKAVQICKNPADFDELTKAWAYYVNIQMSFANKINGGWGTSVATQNQAATWHSKKQDLQQRLQRLEQVHICNEDALRCIERWSSPQTLVYIDPPYPGTELGHYGGYTYDDWSALCELLDSVDCSYVLSNYPQEIEPKSAQQRIEIKAICSASGKGKVGADRTREATDEELGDRGRTEVLWICDRSNSMRKSLSFAKYKQASLLDEVDYG